MRPVRLEMKGFSAFRDETVVDFGGIELVALVGPTGSGKSSVIDAMTFALYGSAARYNERDVAPVINQLSAEARVRFTFEVEGVDYSVTRVVRRTKSGATTKEARLESGGAVLAGDPKQLTEQVVQLLGLTFERFNKTVVLPQGKFSDFLHDTPAARQELMRELLGLGVYERLARRARERASQSKSEASVLESTLGDPAATSDERLAELKTSVATIARVRADVSDAAAALGSAEARLAHVGEQVRRLEEQVELLRSVDVPEAIDDIAAALAAATAAERQAASTRDHARAELKIANEAVALGPSILDCRRLLDLHQRRHELASGVVSATDRRDAASEAASAARRRADAVGAAIVEARAACDAARRQREHAEAAQRAAGDAGRLRSSLDMFDRLAQLDVDVDRLRHEADRAAGSAEEAAARQTAARDLLAGLERRVPAAALAAHLHVGDVCPVCERVVDTLPSAHAVDRDELSAARRACEAADRDASAAGTAHMSAVATLDLVNRQHDELAGELAGGPDRAELEARLQQVLEHEALVEAAKRAVAGAEQALAAIESDPQNDAIRAADDAAAAALAAAEALLARQRSELQACDAELAGQRDELQAVADLDAALALAEAKRRAEQAEEQAEDEHARCTAELEEVLAREGDARKDYAVARDELAALRPPKPTASLADDWSALAAWCAATAATLDDEVALVSSELGERTAERTRLTETIRALAARVVEEPDVPVDTLREQLAAAEADARSAVAQLEKERARVEAAQRKIVQLRADGSVADLLGNLLKNTGFQRWLLEEAMNDLVERATVRLRDLTADQYSLVARDGAFRIVDHGNADEQRDARSLSGGETFLASLALALALADSSMDLAAEGTAPLESMFLDEGFGTLDSDALELVAGTIEELGATGRMVGIITHIRELAERMPTRFEVSKGSNGSTVQRVDA